MSESRAEKLARMKSEGEQAQDAFAGEWRGHRVLLSMVGDKTYAFDEAGDIEGQVIEGMVASGRLMIRFLDEDGRARQVSALVGDISGHIEAVRVIPASEVVVPEPTKRKR